MNIPNPRKRSINAMAVDPPNFGASYDRNTMASSLGSISMLGSDDDSSSDDLEPMDDNEDPEDHILNTPHLHRKSPIVSTTPAPNLWPNPFYPSANHFSGFRKIKFRDAKSRNSSSSASGNSNVPSPVPTSPGGKTESSHFPKENAFRRPPSRRESISKVTNELYISSGNDSGDEGGLPLPSTPGVVRRPVSRRGNLYPKTRAFGRIKAELLEESTPIEAEFRREAEVIRQVLESDLAPPPSVTTMSSPSLQPIIQSLEGIPEDSSTLLTLDGGIIPPNSVNRTTTALFAQMARSNGTKDFWDSLSEKMTPPPAPLSLRNSSSGEDMIVDSPVVSQSSSAFPAFFPHYANSEPSRSSTPQPAPSQCNQQNTQTPQQTTPQQQQQQQQPPPTVADMLRRTTKRRRDDDLDALSLKRRAVSPGVSVTNSPVLSQQSPSQRGSASGNLPDLWDRALQQQQQQQQQYQPQQQQPQQQQSLQSPQQQQQSQSGQLGGVRGGERERASSISSVVSGTPLLGPKRVGLHGMNDMQGLTEKMTLE
jgi:hypothetical protein